jgi:malate dehydrogenase (oxaloacetate-decarboxylating)
MLDAGTDNRELLADPLYLGWRHERVRGPDYDDFIDTFVEAAKEKFPHVLLQWEDFSKHNASRLLERYRDHLCTFNDDIQGTGAVTLAGLFSAMKLLKASLGEQRIVILGAGSSAIGISDQIVSALLNEGYSELDAKRRLWLIDSKGLVHDGRDDLEASKQRYARSGNGFSSFDLAEVVSNVYPTILIGTSGQAGAFSEAVVREMASHVERPVIFPLSNPTSKCEATPADLFAWTEGRALVATGSPFPPVSYGGSTIRIGQCNNAFIFPGVGLGVIASRARRVTEKMFSAAARVLSEFADGALYPPLERVREISREVALAVGTEAIRSGLSPLRRVDTLESEVVDQMWTPRYLPVRRAV